MRSNFFTIPLLLVVAAASGCGGGSDRPRLAQASGIVTLDGEPVEGAIVNFLPVAGGRLATGTTDATGRYTLTTFDRNDGAAVGEHYIGVVKMGGDGMQQLAQAEVPADEEGLLPDLSAPGVKQPEIEYLVPERYGNPKESQLKLTVPTGGTDNLNIALISESAQPAN